MSGYNSVPQRAVMKLISKKLYNDTVTGLPVERYEIEYNGMNVVLSKSAGNILVITDFDSHIVASGTFQYDILEVIIYYLENKENKNVCNLLE